MNGGKAKMRRVVAVPGSNELTAADLVEVLKTVPPTARVRTFARTGKEPDIHLWWDEEIK